MSNLFSNIKVTLYKIITLMTVLVKVQLERERKKERNHSEFKEKLSFSIKVMSEPLWPQGLQHTRLPCPSLSPGVCYIHIHWVSDAMQPSHPLLLPFSSCPQSFPTSGSFPVSQLFASGDQSIGVPASASVFLMNSQEWFPLGLTGWISL